MMKRHVLSVVVPVLVLAAFLGCPSKHEVKGVPGQATTRQGAREGLEVFPSVICRESKKCFHPSTKESKPQSPYYQAGCLEQLQRFEIPAVGSIPRSFFTGLTADGEIASEWTVKAQHEDGPVTIKLSPSVDTPSLMAGVQLYKVKHNGQPVCEKLEDEIIEVDPKNVHGLQGLALAVPGYWDNGVWQASDRYFTLSCLTGVVAKCVLWGYVPWEADMGRYHRTCVQAARARYLKTQKDPAFTCQKTAIDVYDRLGRQQQGNDGGFVFESLWGEGGLICVNRPRWKHCEQELMGGGVTLEPECPDPADGGTGWPDGGLIAIQSSPSNEARNQHGAGRCPTADDALCPGCRINNAGP